MFLLCPVVPVSAPMLCANIESSTWRASPLHTCSGGGIILPPTVFSSIVLDVFTDPTGGC